MDSKLHSGCRRSCCSDLQPVHTQRANFPLIGKALIIRDEGTKLDGVKRGCVAHDHVQVGSQHAQVKVLKFR